MSPPPKGPTTERGSAAGDGVTFGWNSWGGGDDLEKVAELRWPTSVRTYNSMMNDAQAYSLVNGLLLPIRAYRWYLDENNARPETVQRIANDYNLPIGVDGEFFRRRGQRRFSFDKHLEDALRAVWYGHFYFEQVGEITDDLVWHLRKLGVLAPRTIQEIEIDENDGALKWVKQSLDPKKPPIPVNRLVLYVWDREGANWVGRSMLRPIYRNHVVKDRVLRVGAINIERAGGVPFVQAPEGASADQIAELDQLARRFRVGEGAGAALPHGAQLKFASAANGDGAVQYIKLQNEEMARSFMQMVTMLGQTNSGSRGLGDKFHELVKIAQFTIAKWYCDIFNEHVIEDDVEWNEGPDEEFAPLLKFDAGLQDPMMGFQEADGEDTGLMVNDPETRAQLGLDPAGPRPRRRRRAQAARGGSTRQNTNAGGVRAASLASQVSLPPRPLRRQPFNHEIEAAVDYALLDSAYDIALSQLVNEMRSARTFQIDDLRDQIAAAGGDLRILSDLSTEVSASDRIRSHLENVASISMDQAVQEANRQGVDIPRQPVSDIADNLTERAGAVDALLRDDIIQAAQRQAIRLTGGGLSSQEVAEETHTFLMALTGAAMIDILGGAVQQSVNAGRKLVYQRDTTDGTIFASELLDTNTCSPCIHIDGTPYESVEEAEKDYPTGGFKYCEGRERCRGTLVKVYARDREPVTV